MSLANLLNENEYHIYCDTLHAKDIESIDNTLPLVIGYTATQIGIGDVTTPVYINGSLYNSSINTNIGSMTFYGAGVVTLNVYAHKNGNMVTLSFSDSNIITASPGGLVSGTSIPVEYRPTTTQSGLISCINGGIYTVGGCRVGSNGVIALGEKFEINSTLEGFNAGQLQILNSTITYLII
jgi:glucose uptake protein GlcU